MWCDRTKFRVKGSESRRGKANSRGQTLVLVVLIMLVVALLAALLVAIIISNQARIGRSGNVAALNNTVEAGLRYADYQLTYSADGADWRPTPATDTNPFPYTFGRGQFKLTLSYDPSTGGELANFIKIECSARLLDNENKPIPTLRNTQTAYKPILLADYLRFITNKDRSSLPAVLGVPGVLQGTGETPYASNFYGPIRANSDINWSRNSSLGSTLTAFLYDTGTDASGFSRRDRIQTSGSFLKNNGAAVRRWDSVGGDWSPILSNPGIETYASTDPNSTFDVTLGFASGLPIYVDGVNRPDKNNYLRNVRYQDPPSIDTVDPTTGQSRYLLLTRDSGTWTNKEEPAGSGIYVWYNTGWYGYGSGIYVDNFADIQDGHSLTTLRNKWMNPTLGTNYWDPAGWSYTPPGVEIILHPDQAGSGLGVPVIEINRGDGTWKNSTGVDTGSKSQYFTYPINGVIYAEGNVRVSGVLPPASNPAPSQYYVNAASRYFDLSIVSGGTIYIEGDLISPAHYGTASSESDVRNTRLALLARDNVCLNLTACGAKLDSANTTATWSTNQWQLSSANQVAWTFRSFQPTISPLLYIRHAGLVTALGWDNAPTVPLTLYPSLLGLTVGGTAFDWGGGATTFSYHPTYTASLSATSRTLDQAAPNDWEVSVRAISSGITSGATNSIIAANSGAVGANNDVAIAGFQVLPAKINIDALIFAQEGSWFVLPGPWFNGSWNYLGSDVDDTGSLTTVPSYHMALGSIPAASGGAEQPHIYFNGAITESHTAALGDAHDWLSKWSGPGANPLISYTFDGGLRSRPYSDANGNLLMRIPKLPCPPGLIIWGKP